MKVAIQRRSGRIVRHRENGASYSKTNDNSLRPQRTSRKNSELWKQSDGYLMTPRRQRQNSKSNNGKVELNTMMQMYGYQKPETDADDLWYPTNKGKELQIPRNLLLTSESWGQGNGSRNTKKHRNGTPNPNDHGMELRTQEPGINFKTWSVVGWINTTRTI